MIPSLGWNRSRPWLVFILQAVCVLFILSEEISGLIVGDLGANVLDNDTLEFMVLGALVFGLIASAFEIRKNLSRQRRMEQQIKAASGAFSQLMEDHFEEWVLTPSECDVALMAIKGFSIAEIAAVRKTAEGTVKAQCNAIYRKAGVSGRPQLLSLFIDELLYGSLIPAETADPQDVARGVEQMDRRPAAS